MIESKVCLLPMVTPQSQYLIRLYTHYKNRLLPHSGGLLEQPNFYLEAMETLAGRDALLQAEADEKQRRELGLTT